MFADEKENKYYPTVLYFSFNSCSQQYYQMYIILVDLTSSLKMTNVISIFVPYKKSANHNYVPRSIFKLIMVDYELKTLFHAATATSHNTFGVKYTRFALFKIKCVHYNHTHHQAQLTTTRGVPNVD